jgi:hypothetical protein
MAVNGRVRVLEEDPGLYAALSPERQARALAASLAGVVHVNAPGSWDARDAAHLAADGYGLLALDGLLMRRVGVEGRFGAELLGSGDLLRPWQHDGEEAVLPFDMAWQVVAPVRLAVLDLRWAARMAPFPEVGAQLAGRALDRSRRLAVLMALAQQPRLEQRLWMLFWELADRHGRVRPDGVHLDLPLTHELISHLAAARRPSVSAALSKLAQAGVIERAGRGWLLKGAPPERPLAATGP